MKTLELKSKISEILKKSSDVFDSNLDNEEERIFELEDRSKEIIQTEEQREEVLKKKKNRKNGTLLNSLNETSITLSKTWLNHYKKNYSITLVMIKEAKSSAKC